MIERVAGDIWEAGGWLVIPVNCVGVVRAGLAKEMARKYPTQTEHYVDYCKDGNMRLGAVAHASPIIFFPTKYHWKDRTHEGYVASGLRNLISVAAVFKQNLAVAGPVRMNIPALGCGCGRLAYESLERVVATVFGEPEQEDLGVIYRLYF